MAEWDSGESTLASLCAKHARVNSMVGRLTTVAAGTKETVKRIPLLTTKAGPRDKGEWEGRLKEELRAIIS